MFCGYAVLASFQHDPLGVLKYKAYFEMHPAVHDEG